MRKRNKALLMGILVGLFLLGSYIISEIKSTNGKSSRQEIYQEITEKYPDNDQSQDICFKKACESFGLKYSGSSVPEKFEVGCRNELGFEIGVDIDNTEVKECDEVAHNWLQQEWALAREGIF